MALYIRTPTSNSTVTVSSITNSLGGTIGLIRNEPNGGDTNSGFYTVNLPWSINLNGNLYDYLYVSSKGLISFGTATVDASPTTPTTDKILLGIRSNTSVPDTYTKNFYFGVSGSVGNRTLRMRYEGGFNFDDTTSFIWEAILYENDTNRIDIQLGDRTNPGTDNHYFGVYSADGSLYNFPSISNAGYQIVSTYNSPTWATVQNLYARTTSAWQTVRNLYAKDDGFWKLIHPNPKGPLYFFCKRSTYQNDIYGNKGGTGIATFQNDTFIVPSGVTVITVELWGGGGSGGSSVYGGDTAGQEAISGTGGGGGYVKATLSVTPGETLIVRVGGGAWHYAANVLQHPSIAISGASSSNIQVVSRRSDVTLSNQTVVGGIGGSGGGYSAIFRGLTPLLIAGGGGGGGGTNGFNGGGQSYGGNGGAGGGGTGQSGTNGFSSLSASSNTGYGGAGGSQTAGGLGGAGTSASACFSSRAESGSYLTGGRGKNSPEYQGSLTSGSSTSVLIPDNGTASNPGTNGGAAGGAGGRTSSIVCNSGTVGAIQVTINTLYVSSNSGGGGGGGYYGGGGGGVGRANLVLEDTSHGGGGGGGGSNYVDAALSLFANNQGNRRVPGNTTSQYYLTSYLYAPSGSISGSPFNAFAQGGVGYGGQAAVTPVGNSTTINYGTRGENGLVVITW